MREASSITNLKPGAHVHLMGICGTAMGSLAGILQEKGFRVSGSDENVYPPMSTQLEKLGIEIMKGFKASNLDSKPDFVVVGNVMTAKMDETKALMESDLKFSSLPQVLGELFLKDRENVVCCGTHGKTTTTSMVTWALETLGEHPGYLIGGVPANFSYSFSGRDSKWFAIEGDEYDTAFFDKVPKFKHYYPKNTILTSVEFDHIDIYDNLEQVKDAFRILLQRTKDLLVYNADDENIKDLLNEKEYDFKTKSYGKSSDAFAQILKEEVSQEGTTVFLKYGDTEISFFGAWHGNYNTMNFLATLCVLESNGFELDKITESAKTFKGVARRQQCLVDKKELKVFEDFAHHPSAVRLTLEAFKARFPNSNLIGIFEPRSATSRKSVFQKDYVKSFLKADLAVIAPVQKKSEEDTFSSNTLVNDINTSGGNAKTTTKTSQIPSLIKENLKGDDVVIFMSNGGFEGIHLKFAQEFLD